MADKELTGKQPARILVLGGTRSGKSAYAERRVLGTGLRPVYLATGERGDGEMAARIAAHRRRRGAGWMTIEEPLDLAAGLARETGPDRIILVDCLTLWLANLFDAKRGVDEEMETLARAVDGVSGPLVIVSNEIGSGVVPDNALARRFADAQGMLNQRIAAAVDEVVLVAAGLPIILKSPQSEVVQ